MFKNEKAARSCCLLGGGGFKNDPDAMERLERVIMELITDYEVRDFWISYNCKMGIYAYSFIKSLPASLGTFRMHLVALDRNYEEAQEKYGCENMFDSIEMVTDIKDTLFGDFEAELEYILERTGHLVYYQGAFTLTGEILLKAIAEKGCMTITYLGCSLDALVHIEREYERKQEECERLGLEWDPLAQWRKRVKSYDLPPKASPLGEGAAAGKDVKA